MLSRGRAKIKKSPRAEDAPSVSAIIVMEYVGAKATKYMNDPVKVLLISTYELGRQPFGLASPAAWLRRAGAEVECVDLSRQKLDASQVRSAQMIAFYVPMHTAARLAAAALPEIRAANANAHICFYGLYAPVNEAYFRSLGAHTILGGEFEAGLVSAFERVRLNRNGARPIPNAPQPEPVISLGRQEFRVPDRAGLPPLARYA